MLTVTFDGVEYTKATHVAKQFGYTADYLGQLCRAKKVNARLVGRSWFLNIPSLEAHREKKYKKVEVTSNDKSPLPVKVETIEKTQNSDKPSKNYLRRVPAPEVATRKVFQVEDKSGVMRHATVHYEEDDQSLIPTVSHRPKVTLLKVNMADAESIKVKSTEKAENTLKPEPLPAVSLSGSLIVSAIPDVDESEEEKIEAVLEKTAKREDSVEIVKNTKHKEPKKAVEKKLLFTRDKSKNKLKITEVESLTSESKVVSLRVKNSREDTEVKVRVQDKLSDNLSEKTTFEQKLAAIPDEKDDKTHVLPVKGENPVQVVGISYQLPVLATVTALVIAILILSAEHVAFVSLEMVDFNLTFDWKKVTNLALVLFTG